ncbi:MAG: NDP-sugar synthase [Armatimonadota bacterium]
MRDELEALGRALLQGTVVSGAPPRAELPERVVVAIPAGGFGYRMRAVNDQGPGTQKSLLPLPTGETLIGRIVREYAEIGVRRFVALVNYEGQAVEEHLRGGAPWGVEVRCSYDPEPTGSGRTGAMVHAMDQGLLPEGADVVVHNADCHVYGYDGSFPRDLIATHAEAVRSRNAIATLAAVDGWRFPYTGMSLRDGQVTDVAMYPFIPIPAHTGITVVTPEALAALREHHTQTKQNFERDMFPRWAAAGRLAAMVIRHDQWVAVDDRKTYREFSNALSGT